VTATDLAQQAADGGGLAVEADDGSAKASVTEAQRLRGMVDAISALTAVQPKGDCFADAHNRLASNKLFSGLDHPDKLEDFQHRLGGSNGEGAARGRRSADGLWRNPQRRIHWGPLCLSRRPPHAHACMATGHRR
jgi:hypothetical protein